MADIQWQFGVTLKKENLEGFKDAINKYIEELHITDIKPVLNIDMEVTLRDLSIDTVKELSKLEPFGEANGVPQFLIKNLKIESIRTITEGEHLKLRLKDGNTNLQINAIGFHFGECAEDYKIGDKVDIVGNLDINSFNGIEEVQINIKDIIKSL